MGAAGEGLTDLRNFFDEQGRENERNGANCHKNSSLPSVKNKGKCYCVGPGNGIEKEKALWNEYMIRPCAARQRNGHGDSTNSEQA